MEIDAVEVIAGLLRGDGKLCLLDQAPEVLSGEREGMTEIFDA
jgi:hypothetical protein